MLSEYSVQQIEEQSQEKDFNVTDYNYSEKEIETNRNHIVVDGIDTDEYSTDSILAFDDTDSTMLENQNKQCNGKPMEFINVVEAERVHMANSDVSVESVKNEESVANVVDVLDCNAISLVTVGFTADDCNNEEGKEVISKSNELVELCGNSVDTTSGHQSKSSNTQNYMKLYPWFLYEEGDECYGYCLYCDLKVHMRSFGYIKKHGLSLQHMERSKSYLTFQREEEKNGICVAIADIKQEFGTDNHVAAMIYKRKAQAEALQNFNWKCWLRQHKWLRRDLNNSNVGYCIYCNIHLNVEFAYLRKRHEESGKHKLAVNEKFSQKPFASANVLCFKEDSINSNDSNSALLISNKKQKSILRYCEILDGQPFLCRCQICNIKMSKRSFVRHILSKNHMKNEKNYSLQQRDDEKDVVLESHENNIHHEIFAGISNGARHREQRDSFSGDELHISEKASSSYQDSMDMVELNAPNDDINARNTYENKSEILTDVSNTDEASNTTSIRINSKHVSDDWFNRYPWCKRYNKNPKKYFLCTYCNLILKMNCSRSKHQRTSRHMTAQKALNLSISSLKQSDDSGRYPWEISNGNQTGMYYCKYCERSISKHFSKNQHQRTRKHLIKEKNFKAKNRDITSDQHVNYSNIDKDAGDKRDKNKKLSLSSTVLPRLDDFDWLVCKRTKGNTTKWFCNTCQQFLVVRTYNHAFKHQNTKKHALQTDNILNNSTQLSAKEKLKDVPNNLQKKANKSYTEQSDLLSGYKEKSDPNSIKLDENRKNDCNEIIKKLSDKFAWIEKSSKDNHVYCSKCRVHLPINYSLLKAHHISAGHSNEDVNIVFSSQNNFINQNVTESSTTNTADIDLSSNTSNDEDAMIVDSIQEIRRQNISDASLDLLNGGERRNLRPANVRKRLLSGKLVASQMKRLKIGDPGESNGVLSSTSNASFVANLSTAPLTLGSYLGQIIQKPTQDGNNMQHWLTTSSNVHQNPKHSVLENNDTSKDNSYDLFFRSISETIKKLPLDIATEGKLKIMQVICDLEVKALKRQLQQNEEDISSCGLFPTSADLNIIQSEPSNNISTSSAATPTLTPLRLALYTSNKTSPSKTVVATSGSTTINPVINVIKTPIPLKIGKAVPIRNSFGNVNSSGIRCIPLKSLTTSTPNMAPIKIQSIKGFYVANTPKLLQQNQQQINSVNAKSTELDEVTVDITDNSSSIQKFGSANNIREQQS